MIVVDAPQAIDYVTPCDESETIMTQRFSKPTQLMPTLSRRGFVAGTGALAGMTTLPTMGFADDGDDAALKAALSPRYIGDADAPVTIAEYYSMTCGHCASFHNNTFPMVKTRLIDKGIVRFEMRAFPLDGLALRAHALARSLPEAKFFPMVKTLLAQQPSWSRAPDPLAELMKIARFAGVGEEQFNNIMRNRPLLEGIVAQRQQGLDDWDISSTPSFVVNNDTVIAGNMSYEDFAEKLSAYGA